MGSTEKTKKAERKLPHFATCKKGTKCGRCRNAIIRSLTVRITKGNAPQGKVYGSGLGDRAARRRREHLPMLRSWRIR